MSFLSLAIRNLQKIKCDASFVGFNSIKEVFPSEEYDTGIKIKISRLSSGRISLEDSQADWSLNVTSFGSKNSKLFLSIF